MEKSIEKKDFSSKAYISDWYSTMNSILKLLYPTDEDFQYL